jgi:dihydrofolate reductase
MGSVRIYVATSADGFIADRDGGVDWLGPYDPQAYGYDAFWSEVGAVVMGRRTYDHVLTFADAWPYAGRRSFVVSSSPLPKGKSRDVTACAAPISSAIDAARAATSKDVWIVGGAVTMRSALEQGLVDRVELFYIPVFLGEGIPLLGPLKRHVGLDFQAIETFSDGVVKLAYKPTRR